MALAAGRPARRVDRDDLEVLTRSHLPLVYKSVARVIGRIPRQPRDDDLVAAAMMGLVQAAIAFDPARNVSFAGFAALRVRGAVLDELRRTDWASRPVRTRAKRMQAASERLTGALGRHPTDAELANDLGIDVDELHHLVGDVHRALVLSITPAGDSSPEVAGEGSDPLTAILEQETRDRLSAAIADLPPRLHTVIVGYYFDGRTMRDLGEQLGVTESRVCQLCGEAVDRLRGAVVDRPWRVVAQT
ncbi:MAG: sigma-70 family RNA polymerase sigma factor [Acidimicrobiales bacterium]